MNHKLQPYNSESMPLARRGLLGWLMGFSITATLAGVLTPIIGYLLPPRGQSGTSQERSLVGTLADFPPNTGQVLPVGDRPVIVTNPQGTELKAFSAICTHLGCVVHWHEAGQYILCPCHDGRFDPRTGAVISGPPPRPLPPYQLVLDGQDVYVGQPLDSLYGES